jgi:RNA polymerase sigma-70 factor (ECF subfamily)
LDNLELAVDRVLKGDHSAFQSIVDATSHKLVRLGARIMGNQADAEDVVQEAYVKAYRALSAGEFDRRSSTATWLYRIVVNGAIDAKRSRTRRAEDSDVQVEPGWDGAAFAEARLALAELDEWLAALPADQRAALVLQSMEGLTNTEIAQVMGVSEGAVEQRLVRARATLRQVREKKEQP